MHFLSIASTIVLGLVISCSPANACSCTPEASAPACQVISWAQVAFLGECVDLVPDPSGGSTFGRNLYRFRVERAYKGLDPSIREVLVNPMNLTSCAAEYPTGKTYLMFAGIVSQQPLLLVAGECSGSRRADLNKADVEFLETYLQGKSETAVYGRVLQWVTWIGRPRENDSAPLGGAKVTLSSADNRFTSISQPDGSFAFSGVPPGEYRLSARLNQYTAEPESYAVSVSKGGCKEVFIQLKARSSIEEFF
jgi:hypothetical protein